MAKKYKKLSKNTGWKKLKLWPHQTEVIPKIEKFLKLKSDSSFLVKMPTGSGKTAVISTISILLKKVENVLIVVPSEALREQLYEEIKEKFWNKLDYTHNNEIKEVHKTLPSQIGKILGSSSKLVIILTIQSLQIISEENKDNYNNLKKLIHLIIFDEGHKEPSPEWSKSVRSFKKPTILFTATPFRNDLKLFNIEGKNYEYVKHSYVLNEKFIREIIIEEDDGISKNEKVFVDFVVKKFAKEKPNFIKQGIKNPKVIIRCNNVSEIRKIAAELKSKGHESISIHDQLNDKSNPNEFTKIPKGFETINFWIHQFKLVEGIDNNSFCCLAIFKPFLNTRSLIQQIGRIIRSSSLSRKQKGIVICDSYMNVASQWHSYLSNDELFEIGKPLENVKSIVNDYLFAQPNYYYIENKIRKRFDWSNSVYDKLKYPLRTNIYNELKACSIETYQQKLDIEWKNKELDIKKTEFPLKNILIVTYLVYHNSPILESELFLEFKLAFCILIKKNKRIYFYDSLNHNFNYLDKYQKTISNTELNKLLVNTERFNRITLFNSDLGQHSIRSRTISAHALENTAPNLSDHMNFYTTAQVKLSNDDNIYSNRRYVGFSKSRVTDSLTSKYVIYKDWINVLDKKLSNAKVSGHDFLNRYAVLVTIPNDVTPTNILLDTYALNDEFVVQGKKSEIEIEDKCISIKANEFKIIINKQKYSVKISFDLPKEKYVLSCPDLESDYQLMDSKTNKRIDSIVSYLNKNQSFRIIPKSDNIIYAHKQFYKSQIDLVGRTTMDKLPVMSIFEDHSEITSISSEKGNDSNLKVKAKMWNKNTLFGLIATQAKGRKKNLQSLFGFNLMVCNDLSTEESDFIAADSIKNRIVFMHAKASSTKKLASASIFQDVCAQLIKNLDYLSPYSERKLNYKKWDKEWSIKKIGKVNRRILGNGNGKSFLNDFDKIIKDPNSTKEVWIVLGNGFRLDEFKKRLNTGGRAELIQIVYLLTSTWSAAAQVGAKLRVLC
jgi:superfamily II DNA or RNA helicase